MNYEIQITMIQLIISSKAKPKINQLGLFAAWCLVFRSSTTSTCLVIPLIPSSMQKWCKSLGTVACPLSAMEVGQMS